jgi:hypothetical protein
MTAKSTLRCFHPSHTISGNNANATGSAQLTLQTAMKGVPGAGKTSSVAVVREAADREGHKGEDGLGR